MHVKTPVTLRPSRLRRALAYRRIKRRLAGPRLIRAFADAYPRASFVEIGSNDGKQHDHLRSFITSREWTGVMVEPVPYVFERLRRNYAGLDGVALENAAIAGSDGRLPFYHLTEVEEGKRERLPDWYDGIGSFFRAAVLRHADRIPDIERRLLCTEVPALTLESLCRKHGMQGMDLLLIDAEGYDWEIVRHADLAAHNPRLVIYEHYHLEANVRRECRAHLERLGYETMEEGLDTFCLRPRPADRLTGTWRRLRPAVPGVSIHEEIT